MSEDATLRSFLDTQGHSPEMIAKIMERLEQHDRKTVREAVFDSVERESFNIEAIVQEALEEIAADSE